ncbi:MAG: hypothetical protein R6W31_01115 [Bacteroidales bacterium]
MKSDRPNKDYSVILIIIVFCIAAVIYCGREDKVGHDPFNGVEDVF